MGRTVEHTLRTSVQASDLVLEISGTLDSEARDEIRAALDALDGTAERARARRIVVDVRALNFIISLCINEMLKWMVKVEASNPRPYAIVFRVGKSSQRRTFEPMCRLAPSCTTIEQLP